jgi:DNA-binding MarR family transcriptional regulator
MTAEQLAAAFSYTMGAVGHRIRRCHQLSVALFAEEVTPFDLTTLQYAALATIASHENMDATRLAGLLAFDRSTVGSVLERLEAKELITRHHGPGNKRIKLLRATARGREVLVAADDAVHRSQDRFLAVLNPIERATLLGLLEKLIARHEALDEAV